jgi:translation initiation factor eIF-2B subunit alpha
VQGIQFSVVVTEGRPDATGLAMAKALDELKVPVVAILDCAVAYALEALRCDNFLLLASSRTV